MAGDIAGAAISAGAVLAGVAATAATTAWTERRRSQAQLAMAERAAAAERAERVRQRVVEVVTTARDILDLDMIMPAPNTSQWNEKKARIDAATSTLLASSVDLASLDPELGEIADDARLAVFEHVNPDIALRSEEELLEAANQAIRRLLQEHGRRSR